MRIDVVQQVDKFLDKAEEDPKFVLGAKNLLNLLEEELKRLKDSKQSLEEFIQNVKNERTRSS